MYNDFLIEASNCNDDIQRYVIKISGAVKDIKSNFFYIGFLLNELNNSDFFNDDIIEFSYNNFGFKKSFTYQLMSISRLFADNSMHCLDKYSDYSISQLNELLSVPDHLRYRYTSDMSVSDMRHQKKIDKGYLFDQSGKCIGRAGYPDSSRRLENDVDNTSDIDNALVVDTCQTSGPLSDICSQNIKFDTFFYSDSENIEIFNEFFGLPSDCLVPNLKYRLIILGL